VGDEAVIGWIREIVMDCVDPWALARFWAGLLGGTPVEWYPGWVTLEPPPHGQRLSFQATMATPDPATAAPAPPATPGPATAVHGPPATPGSAPATPAPATATPGPSAAGVHFDVLVDDLAGAGERVVAAGAVFVREHVSPRPGPAGEPVGWRVYTDPAGHPFCLVVR
jgi:hypothetical protein